MTSLLTKEKSLDRSSIHLILEELGRRLQQRNLNATVNIIGGAAIALTLKDERVTQDVDAVVITDHSEEFNQLAKDVALDFSIRPDWIGDNVSHFVSDNPDGFNELITYPGIDVYVASPEHILAMKLRANILRMRAHDAEDLVFLLDHLQISPEVAARLVTEEFSDIPGEYISTSEYLEAIRNAIQIDALERGGPEISLPEDKLTQMRRLHPELYDDNIKNQVDAGTDYYSKYESEPDIAW